MTTAERLKTIMAERKLKQIDIIRLCQPLCKKYGERLERNDLSQYISGRNRPRQNKLTILGEALGVSEAWLMGYDVPRERPGDDEAIPSSYDPLPKMKRVPLLGGIACGKPILAVEDHDEDVEMPADVVADFALTCHGDSMKDLRILDGDIVYIRRQNHAENGDIIAAEIDGEATLKRFYRKPNGIMLMPANTEYEPIFVPASEADAFRIDGVAVAFTSAIR